MNAAVPTAVLAAMGKLNVHARACRGLWNPRSAIYVYKHLLTRICIDAGGVTTQFVRWTGKCGHCTDGWWEDFNADGEKRRCRYCRGGTVTLSFTETTLSDGQVWHHPWQGPTAHGRDIARAACGLSLDDDGEYRNGVGALLVWEDARDWAPRSPSEPLPLADLVEHLNTVETFVETVPDDDRWVVDAAKSYLCQRTHRGITGPPSHGYRLDLGHVGERCFACGTGDDLETIVLGCMNPLFHWSLPICRRHRSSPRPAAPPSETIFPALAAWLARHERTIEAAA